MANLWEPAGTGDEPITVRELIEDLKEHDPDMIVLASRRFMDELVPMAITGIRGFNMISDMLEQEIGTKSHILLGSCEYDPKPEEEQ